ncbi:MAG: hypothetical protein ABW123_23130 [Cystobacter sp.]
MSLKANAEALRKLFEALHEPGQVAEVLRGITSENIIALLRFLLEEDAARAESRALSTYSGLFEQLVLLKGTTPRAWTWSLHTHHVPQGAAGEEVPVPRDVVAHPITDAPLASAAMAPLSGTTLASVHEFPSEEGRPSGPRAGFSEEAHREALQKALTRLQLIDLNRYLANRDHEAKAFQHLNSFETALLPRIAELFVLHMTDENQPWSWERWVQQAGSVELDEKALSAITQMDAHALAWLIIASQKHLLDKSFVSDVNALSQHLQGLNALTTRLGSRDDR